MTLQLASPIECDDNYKSVVFRETNYRIVECRLGIHWVIQRRRSNSSAEARWEPISYHCSKFSLLRTSCFYFGYWARSELMNLPNSLSRNQTTSSEATS